MGEDVKTFWGNYVADKRTNIVVEKEMFYVTRVLMMMLKETVNLKLLPMMTFKYVLLMIKMQV